MNISLQIIIIELCCMAGVWGLCAYFAAYRRWYSYNLYKRAFLYYKWYIDKHNYTYESYRDEFILGHETLKFKGERRIRLHTLLNLLQNGRSLIEKYFKKEHFTKRDYKDLINESRVYINLEASNRKQNLIVNGNNEIPSLLNTVEKKAISDEIKKTKIRGRKPDTRTLPEMLSKSNKDINQLLANIRKILLTKNTDVFIAYLKIALEEENLIDKCYIASFRHALDSYYEDIEFVQPRGIQREYNRLNTIVREGGWVKDIEQDRICIDRIKLILLK